MAKIIISNYDDRRNPYYGGGGATAIYQTATRLSRYHDVTIITSAYPESKNEIINSVHYLRIGPQNSGRFFGQLFFLALLPFYALTQKYDLWLENFTPPLCSLFLNLLSSRPIVALVHMLPGADMERKYHLPFRLWEQLVLKLRRQFVVLTPAVASQIAAINPRAQITIIPNGVNLPPKTASGPARHILFIGRLEINQKGLDLLLDAYRQVLSPHPLPLVIAGCGSAADTFRLRRLILKLGLSRCVRLAGWVTGTAKDRLYRQALCVVAPSRFETFSLVALETLSYGLPLVCFNIPGFSWVPSSCCLKVPPFDASKLSQAIAALVHRPALCQALGRRARKTASAYSWDAVAGQYRQLISRLA